MLRAGRMHTLTLSDFPFRGRVYIKRHNVDVDSNLKECGADVLTFLNDMGVRFITLGRDNVVEGRSWEMSVVEAALGGSGVYSGTVERYSIDEIVYGHVPGLAIKKQINPNVISAYDIKGRSFSR